MNNIQRVIINCTSSSLQTGLTLMQTSVPKIKKRSRPMQQYDECISFWGLGYATAHAEGITGLGGCVCIISFVTLDTIIEG